MKLERKIKKIRAGIAGVLARRGVSQRTLFATVHGGGKEWGKKDLRTRINDF